ncbi:Uncharacterized protein TCAP_02910 [Tolypocladium capitatum]|uniref:Sas10 utp3 c1d family protein n=1 Tax=Tolypocladium capitatum TaxID=45235 RepID=A0A2K3QHY9_9HYPO|nr:Uncharacterized protein TCAP_02910 [Tolypocladium capitatum]
MAAPTTLPALLASLTQSLSLTQEAAPKIAAIDHPKEGISLLDVKNELLLSYLQNLVFLILLKLRNSKSGSDGLGHGVNGLNESVRAKLVELRLYLERGARPLEEKLRFSIERFLRTAEDAQREERSKQRLKTNGRKGSARNESGSEPGSDDGESDEEGAAVPAIQRRQGNMSAAPRPGTLIDDVSARPWGREDDPSGVYRPPKRDRVTMETTRPREKSDRRPQKSHVMDEFVSAELSAAPLAEPSIGTTIVQGGRKMKTAQERKDEDERREYEETNLVRLPKLSKKDRAKKGKESGRGGRMEFGGEEWRDLGAGVDRIDRLTKRKGPAGGNVRALLEKSRKRGFDTTDGPRGSGHAAEMGERFQKKVRMLDAGRRDRGKKR